MAMVNACRYRCVELVQFLLEKQPQSCDSRAVSAVFAAGDARILRILYEAGARLTDAQAQQTLESFDPTSDPVNHSGVQAFLQEMHGLNEDGALEAELWPLDLVTEPGARPASNLPDISHKSSRCRLAMRRSSESLLTDAGLRGSGGGFRGKVL
ncbi:hypothetical protein BDK51DRAFT_26912, partial [Blyttiomyces helicus]